MYTPKTIADRVKTMCQVRKLLVKDVLFSCELSKNALSSMQSGGNFPKADNLAKIADQLGCSVDYLLGRTDIPEVNTKKEPSFDSSCHSTAARGTPVSNERFDTLVSQEDAFERSND